MPIIFDDFNLKYKLARMNITYTSTISKRHIYIGPYYVLAIFSMLYIHCIANFTVISLSSSTFTPFIVQIINLILRRVRIVLLGQRESYLSRSNKC